MCPECPWQQGPQTKRIRSRTFLEPRVRTMCVGTAEAFTVRSAYASAEATAAVFFFEECDLGFFASKTIRSIWNRLFTKCEN